MLLAAGLSGCPAPPVPAGALECDDGEACVALEIADPAELVHGPQGGYHLDVGVAFAGIDPTGLVVAYEAREPDGTLRGAVRQRITPQLLARDGGTLRRERDIIILEIEGPGAVVGAALDVRVALEREGAVIAEDVRRVVVIDDTP